MKRSGRDLKKRKKQKTKAKKGKVSVKGVIRNLGERCRKERK